MRGQYQYRERRERIELKCQLGAQRRSLGPVMLGADENDRVEHDKAPLERSLECLSERITAGNGLASDGGRQTDAVGTASTWCGVVAPHHAGLLSAYRLLDATHAAWPGIELAQRLGQPRRALLRLGTAGIGTLSHDEPGFAFMHRLEITQIRYA